MLDLSYVCPVQRVTGSCIGSNEIGQMNTAGTSTSSIESSCSIIFFKSNFTKFGVVTSLQITPPPPPPKMPSLTAVSRSNTCPPVYIGIFTNTWCARMNHQNKHTL
ncbi:hypothetical protein Hanom_Chr06g00483391 [Helianthus anomalus]